MQAERVAQVALTAAGDAAEAARHAGKEASHDSPN